MPTGHGRRKPINRRLIVLPLWDTGYPKRDFCIYTNDGGSKFSFRIPPDTEETRIW